MSKQSVLISEPSAETLSGRIAETAGEGFAERNQRGSSVSSLSHPSLPRLVAPDVDLSGYHHILSRLDSIRMVGKVGKIIGLVVESEGPPAHVGEICRIHSKRASKAILAEVVGFREDHTLLMPLGELEAIHPGSEVVATGRSFSIGVGKELLGRVIDALGNPIDGKGPLFTEESRAVNSSPPPSLQRERITEPLTLGVRALDGLLTCGRGQRVGIFSGSGIGKSTLLGMIARNTNARVNVIGLIGERGREVREFIERDLQEEGLKRSVVVVATSDQAALLRLKGSLVATTLAEYFRDLGMDVILMMDSVTRLAWAQREVGLAIGEPPATRGYTPSVFAMLPKLLERSGTAAHGSITGLYTVLVEADDMNEPIADTTRSILDGHVVLSRRLAAQNHYPAVDVLESISRLMTELVTSDHAEAAGRLKDVLAIHREAEDLINIGAYVAGSNRKIDYALSKIDEIQSFLKQGIYEQADYADTLARLKGLFN